jgi:hypothetical protein
VHSFRQRIREEDQIVTQPQSQPTLEYAKSPEGVRYIATAQKRIILCILVQLCLYAILIAGQVALPLPVRLALLLAMLTTNVVAMVFVFQLTTKLYGTAIGIVLGILVLMPCAGLITLLIVNSKATALLRANGLKVGLLGAKVPDHL